jgi:hypothetical protein
MDIPTILMELAGGGCVSGLGYAWTKCSAYASDWDAFCASPAGAASEFSQRGVVAKGYNICSGEVETGSVPRIHSDTPEKLLGKRGAMSDKYPRAG